MTVGHSTGGAPSKLLCPEKMLTQPTVHFSACFECGVMLGAEALLSLNMEMELLSLRVSDFSMAISVFGELLTITGGLITAITDTGKSKSV